MRDIGQKMLEVQAECVNMYGRVAVELWRCASRLAFLFFQFPFSASVVVPEGSDCLVSTRSTLLIAVDGRLSGSRAIYLSLTSLKRPALDLGFAIDEGLGGAIEGSQIGQSQQLVQLGSFSSARLDAISVRVDLSFSLVSSFVSSALHSRRFRSGRVPLIALVPARLRLSGTRSPHRATSEFVIPRS